MTKESERIGTGDFLKRAGISAPTMRQLEAAGVISPVKTAGSGWRMFTEREVAAVLRWKARRTALRAARAARAEDLTPRETS